ncbi:sugar transferase [Leifsonia sp. fls2-241-R2A-40a]|uniref:sugar transferase n=1 Tax=Leifsonia sp. fls2-241-R2A-40a TaxID=3040290 RepID=UPI00254A9C78|nr:sugar transferase [Leifsonia sp. fls2-241-R2A-40a]
MSPARPYDAVKRVLDVVTAVVVLALGSPVYLVVALLVARKLGRPVLFTQPRPGRGGRVFTLLKFRTMRTNPPGEELPDEERLTSFGRALRSSSLDELPSFVNVLRGDMSVVGPRPLLVSYLERYSPEQARRHDVRPGITGLAQVSGRNTVEWSRRFDLDVEYVEKRSFRLDAWILFRTIRAAVAREGISAEGHATMPEFKPGSPA